MIMSFYLRGELGGKIEGNASLTKRGGGVDARTYIIIIIITEIFRVA